MKKILVFILMLIISAKCEASDYMPIDNNSSDPQEYVVILHGILDTKYRMYRIAKYLRGKQYNVLNVDYPSTELPLEELSQFLYKEIEKYIPINNDNIKIHFVGYSMGGLVIRTFLNNYSLKDKLGKVVLIAVPNEGSEVADALQNNFLYKKIFGPAGQQLVTDKSKTEHLFGQEDYLIGVISGTSSIDPISSAIIDKESDGKVSLQSSLHPNMTDHLIIPASHFTITFKKITVENVYCFIKFGKFCNSEYSKNTF